MADERPVADARENLTPPRSMPRWVWLVAIPFAGLPVAGYFMVARWLPPYPSDDWPHKLAMTFMVPCMIGFLRVGYFGLILGGGFWYIIGLAAISAIDRARLPRDPNRPRISLPTWIAAILTVILIVAARWIGDHWNPD